MCLMKVYVTGVLKWLGFCKCTRVMFIAGADVDPQAAVLCFKHAACASLQEHVHELS